MFEYQKWTYPDISGELGEWITKSNKKYVIVGVIGKSAFKDANKMTALNVVEKHPTITLDEPEEGKIQFYFNLKEDILFLHFQTTYDSICMQKLQNTEIAQNSNGQFFSFNQRIRSRFAKMMLVATQMCHIIVFVELSVTFDASLLPIFKSLKIIHEKHILKFLPQVMKNMCHFISKSGRMCAPRILFLFENYPDGNGKDDESISKLEFEMEDNIYKMLKTEDIASTATNSSASLFSIPINNRFVYYNTDPKLREDPLLKSVQILESLMQKNNYNDYDEDELSELRPYEGFAKPLAQCSRSYNPLLDTDTQERKFMTLLKEHVEEVLSHGKNHFMTLSLKMWFETFEVLHKIFIENPDNPNFKTDDLEYRLYLENFEKILDIDSEFFVACCDIGLKKAIEVYNTPVVTPYGSAVHKKLVEDAVAVFYRYARSPNAATIETKLREMCDKSWHNGKQQCEFPSLRGHPCILPKHIVKDPAEHSSVSIFISACNCGRTQGRREDPYTIKQANYDFYEYMAKNCHLCAKVKKIPFAVFEPSIHDYRAAQFEIAFPKLSIKERTVPGMDAEKLSPIRSQEDDADGENDSQPLTASQGSHTNLSLMSGNLKRIGKRIEESSSSDEDDARNEMILKVKDRDNQKTQDNERGIYRQPSTTEYLPGMVHTESPDGLLPRFPSWSLACVGSSSIYSHNVGLLEHFQSGFLSGSNFLLPWDVHVRLEHSESWAFEKTRYRKMGKTFVLKIFIGYEYECPRGHRFMMSAPDKMLCRESGIMRDSGMKVVYNNMPLYFSCSCRQHKPEVAQLMRVHVVTPKAPVNVILDPKVCTGVTPYSFTLGLANPPKLTQSAYWILRLPYIYQGDEGPILPPREVNATNNFNYGYLNAGMFGVTETEVED